MKKKRRKHTIDKEKVAENKKKAKAKKQRLKRKRKEQMTRIRAEKPDAFKDICRKQMKKILALISIASAVTFVGTGIFLGIRNYLAKQDAKWDAEETIVHAEIVDLAELRAALRHQRRFKMNVSKVLLNARRQLIDTASILPTQITLTEENASNFIKIESCLINTDTGKVDVTISAEGLARSDDNYYYLFEEKTYDTALTSDEYIIEELKDVNLTFSVNLNYNSANSRLFSKFVVAVKKEGKFMPISKPRYITNPEAIAKYRLSPSDTTSKKGLLVDPQKLGGPELDDLGVKYAAYNIPLSRILGSTTNGTYPTVYYSYNGRDYALNGQVIEEYDYVFSALTNKEINITVVVLNDIHPGYMQLIHPRSRSGGRAPYYAFNATDKEGTEYIAAIGSFLASRYSGGSHGKVTGWIIGNEINARSEWNYIEYMDVSSYVEEYAKAFRVFYNAIVSVNGNARVYISLDQQWGKSLYGSGSYASKDVLDEFNRNLKAGSNIDWGVAYHPYNYPLTAARAWSTGSSVQNSETSPVITIKNIHVLTDYLQKESLRTDSGQVRHVSLSEMGYTSSEGQDVQAASFVYAYKIVEANQYIDNMLFSRETDAALEVAQGLAFGINALGGGHKSIYNAYKYVDTANSAAYTDFVLQIIGISSWSEVISPH